MESESSLIDRLLDSARSRYAPDVAAWHPSHRVESHMRIAADGRWFHQASEIKRPEMVSLFAALLRCEGEEHFLVTPVEKAFIEVEDTPFLVVDFEMDGEGEGGRLLVETNLGEWVPVDSPGQLFMKPLLDESGSCPSVEVRGGLVARFSRAAHFRFAEALVEHEAWLGVWSYQRFYALERTK